MWPETRLTSKEDQILGTLIIRKVGFTHLVLGTCVWYTRLNHDLFLVPSHTGYPSQQYLPQQYPSQQYPSQQYPSQQYSSPQSLPTPSRRSTLATTPTYDHAPLPPHQSAPPHLSGSAPYNPSFPYPADQVRRPSTTSRPPAPEPPHRAATMPMPVPVHTASSLVHYNMQSPNTMHSPPQPGFVGGSPPTAQGHNYRASTAVEFLMSHAHNERLTVGVHERYGDPGNFRDENLERGRGDTRRSGEYMRDRSPPNPVSAGNQQLRCTVCGTVVKRAVVDKERGYCPGGHMGQWQSVVIFLSLYKVITEYRRVP
jgi:hypothetical protein